MCYLPIQKWLGGLIDHLVPDDTASSAGRRMALHERSQFEQLAVQYTMKFIPILQAHLARYPGMQLVDIYKLIHQASLGSEHAVRDEEQARRWMEKEIADLGTGPDEPVIDPISPQGDLLRIHLRPFLRWGGDVQSLLQAFVRTANEFQGSLDRLKEHWLAVETMAEKGKLGIALEEVRAFWSAMEARNFPAAHHSPFYQERYRPAYRVVARQFYTIEFPEIEEDRIE